MQGPAKIVVIIAVVVGIIAFVWWRLSAAEVIGGTKPPEVIRNREIPRIDEKTLEIISMPRDEWDKLGKKDGRWQNPETGEYTVANIIYCEHCQKEIPQPIIPESELEGVPPELRDIKHEQLMAQQKCPHCGRPILQ